MSIKRCIHFYCLYMAICWGCTSSSNTLSFIALTTEMQQNPVGIDTCSPRFSWQFKSNRPATLQTAYQIMVAESEEELQSEEHLVWQSGKVFSRQSVLVRYSGKVLKSGKKYFWKVRIWTNQNETCESEIQNWTMVISPTTWQASWIGLDGEQPQIDKENRTILPARYLRKEFYIDSKVRRAVLSICGLGSSECYVNGKKVSEDVFGPLPTLYEKKAMYLTYDVTELLQQGQNAIGVLLGNGRFFGMRSLDYPLSYGLPRLLAQLEIEDENGKHILITDETWKVTDKGPIRSNNEYDGEIYDARMELGQWTFAGYDDENWCSAQIMENPTRRLCPQPSPCMKVMEKVNPVSVFEVSDGTYIVDMGQNMVGWINVALQGEKGRPVVIRFSETLKPGIKELYTDNLRSAKCMDVYIPANEKLFTWEPRMVYHGFRFIEISGVSKKVKLADIEGKVIYDNMRTIGHFCSSDTVLNRIYRNAYWGIRGNYRGMPTDCPQRDERMAWLGDRTTGAYGESFLFANALLYNKWLDDIEESMSPAGRISNVSPRYWTIYKNDVTWPAAYFYIANMLYEQFGDSLAVQKHYPSMKRWVKQISESSLKNGIITIDTYGDWCVPPESPNLIHSQKSDRQTDGRILGTAVFYSILQLMEKFALINRAEADRTEYDRLATQIKEAYNEMFLNTAEGYYGNNTVTANILSLRTGLVPEKMKEKVFHHVVQKTKVDFHSHISTGVIGIQHLMRGLTEHGAGDLAYILAANETYPSWGYMAKNGATTIWELWNGNTADPAMNSGNHVMLLGDLLIWMYENLAGIQSMAPGFRQIRLQPYFPKGLNWVSASYESCYGNIVSEWKRIGDNIRWIVMIPANTSAEICMPSKYRLKELPRPKVESLNTHETLDIGSGTYEFMLAPM